MTPTRVPWSIERDEVGRLAAEGVPLVDVLPRRVYAEQHIAGAINIPLGELDRRTTELLHADDPVIVYCNDYT
jgi:rhodanese-related sulfurtransferase